MKWGTTTPTNSIQQAPMGIKGSLWTAADDYVHLHYGAVVLVVGGSVVVSMDKSERWIKEKDS